MVIEPFRYLRIAIQLDTSNEGLTRKCVANPAFNELGSNRFSSMFPTLILEGESVGTLNMDIFADIFMQYDKPVSSIHSGLIWYRSSEKLLGATSLQTFSQKIVNSNNTHK